MWSRKKTPLEKKVYGFTKSGSVGSPNKGCKWKHSGGDWLGKFLMTGEGSVVDREGIDIRDNSKRTNVNGTDCIMYNMNETPITMEEGDDLTLEEPVLQNRQNKSLTLP